MHLIMSGFYGDLILLVGGAKLFDTQLPHIIDKETRNAYTPLTNTLSLC